MKDSGLCGSRQLMCPTCGGVLWWRSRMGARVCMRCYPDPLQALDALAGRWPRGPLEEIAGPYELTVGERE
jgi:hypothetical protein